MRKLELLGIIFAISAFCFLGSDSQTTEVRLMGMGELHLVIEDEANMVNLYDFGGNVAGLYLDEPMSAVEGGFSYGTITLSDSSGTVDPKVNYLGQPIPDVLIDYIPDIYKTALPTGVPLGVDFVYRMEGSAIGIGGDFAQAKATFEEMDPEQSITLNVFPSGIIQYNTLFADQFSLGLQAGYLGAKQTADPEMLESKLSNFGAGLGIGLFLSEAATLGGKFNYMKPKLETEIDSVLFDEFEFIGFSADLDGNGFDFGVQGIFHLPGMLKAGAKIGYNSLSGDASMEMLDTTYDIGSITSSGLTLQTRALTTLPLLPVQFAASLGYISEAAKFEPSAEMLVPVKQDELRGFEGSLSTIPIGLGLIYATPLVTAGAELHYASGKETDELADTTLSSSTLSFNLGTEVGFGVANIRGGIVMAKSDPDKDTEKDEFTTKKFTLGLGLTPPGGMFRGDFAYNYITTSPDENPTEQKTTTNLFSMGIKFFF